MSIEEDIRTKSTSLFATQWNVGDGRVVPQTQDLTQGNTGRRIDAAVLYADISSSTQLVDNHEDWFCAEIYKAFLYACSRIIRAQDGEIRSFDGDRVMGVFIGESKCTDAAICALKINHAIKKIINPALRAKYTTDYQIRHTVGVDVSSLMVVRSGMRDSNDLVWIGSAANHAAKLNGLSDDVASRITGKVFNKMHDSAKFGGSGNQLMWEKRTWTDMNRTIYRSNWTWVV